MMQPLCHSGTIDAIVKHTVEKSPSQTLATACGFVLELLWCTNPILNWLTQPVTMQCCTQWRKAPPAPSNGLWLCLGGKFNEKTLFISTVNCQRQTWLNRACTSVWSSDSGTRVCSGEASEGGTRECGLVKSLWRWLATNSAPAAQLTRHLWRLFVKSTT